MKLTISKESLVEQLSHVAGAVEKKQTSKILENILIQLDEDKLKLVGTDLEIEMSTDLDIQAESTGRITAPARKFLDICKALPNDSFVLLEMVNERLTIKSKRSRFELATLPADEFPILDDIPINQEFNIPENKLKQLFDHVSFSMANQDVRYYLNGLLLDFNSSNLTVVATDGHRLAISTLNSEFVETKSTDKLSIIVPRKGILELSRLLDASSQIPVSVQVSENHIRIIKDNIRFTSKLIDGKYPDYQAAIPSNSTHTLKLQREELRDTLSRVAILSNEKFRGIRITLNKGINNGANNGTMSFHSNNPENESAEEEIDVDFSADELEIGFNVTYLLEAINHLEGDIINFEITSADSSALLYSEDDVDTRYVVMPIRL